MMNTRKNVTRAVLMALLLVFLAAGCANSTGSSGEDTGVADTGTPDASSPDTSVRDTGARDTGSFDTGIGADGGVGDTGARDAGAPDTGTPDTGTPDTGTPDTGPPPVVCGDGTCGAGEPVSCEADCDLVPVMTSATSPSGVVTQSGVYSATYPGWQAFDEMTTLWISEVGVAPAWLAYEFGDGPKTLLRYGIRYTNGSLTGRAPRDWLVQGRTGASWTTIDTQTGQSGWTSGEWRRFDIATPGSYEAYRLYITDDNDSSQPIVVISIGELTLLGR